MSTNEEIVLPNQVWKSEIIPFFNDKDLISLSTANKQLHSIVLEEIKKRKLQRKNTIKNTRKEYKKYSGNFYIYSLRLPDKLRQKFLFDKSQNQPDYASQGKFILPTKDFIEKIQKQEDKLLDILSLSELQKIIDQQQEEIQKLKKLWL